MTFIIPYRNRSEHLAQFLKHYRRLFPQAYFLVVEQSLNLPFNRAALFNIGVLEQPAEYYIFHDVDMLVQGVPDYSSPLNPTHCATHASQFGMQMPFPEYFGGVVLMTRQHLEAVNGWPNNFFRWGGEDNEMRNNILAKGLTIDTREHRYLSLPHSRNHPTGYDPEKDLQAQQPRADDDGLTNTNYKLLTTLEFNQGRKITVELL